MKDSGTATVTEENITNQCTNVSYPQVEGLENKTVQDRINQLIKNQVYYLIPPEGCDVYQDITGKYEVEVNEKGILSIKFDVYSIRKYAANGLDVQRSLTVNLQTGEVYRLYDLFKINSDYRVVLTRIIQEQIREKNIPLLQEFKGITDFADFYLTENELVIYFQEIEYTPHYIGIPEFAIPYSQIKNLISPEGPVAILTDPCRLKNT